MNVTRESIGGRLEFYRIPQPAGFSCFGSSSFSELPILGLKLPLLMASFPSAASVVAPTLHRRRYSGFSFLDAGRRVCPRGHALGAHF